MKKLFTLSVIFIGLITLFTACSSSDSKGETNPLAGWWYITENGRIISLDIDDNGTGDATIYTYTGDEWTTQILPLQYTIADGNIAIKAGNDYTLSGKMAITGSSLSVTNGEKVYMFTGYDGKNKTIEHLQKEIEEKTLIVTPGNEIIQENFWNSEVNAQTAIAGIYARLIDFEYNQANIENIRITGRDLSDRADKITPQSNNVTNCWNAAYATIAACNNIIEHAPEEYRKYANEARALRCLLYYNIAHLWGSAPYVTTTNTEAVINSPILSKEEIFTMISDETDMLLGEFDGSIVSENYGIDAASLLAIKAEIELSRGNKREAEEILLYCQPNFSLYIDENKENIYSFFGEEIKLYTPQYIELLKAEAQNSEALHALWEDIGTHAYGYWAMLKRTGKAQDVTGCKEHELLLPFPDSELRYNANLIQNPGY